MKKMKEFYQEHKDAIANAAWLIVGAAVGVCAVSIASPRGFTVTNGNLKKVLVGAQKEFGAGNITIFTGRNADGLNVDQLGELGNAISMCGGQDNVFKYFVAIGPDKK